MKRMFKRTKIELKGLNDQVRAKAQEIAERLKKENDDHRGNTPGKQGSVPD